MKPVIPSDPAQRMVFAAVIYIVVLTLFRLCFSVHLDLVPDEAYYWQWSRHFDWCYRDKGPLVAWAIALSTSLAGDTVFGVRWLGVILAAGTAWQIFTLARRLFNETVGLAALGIATIIPLFAIGSIIMTIDSLSVFFWAWAANLAWAATHSNRKRDWALLGFAVGCGFLAKFTNVLQLASIFAYLLWTPSCRRYIISIGTVIMGAVFALCTTPIIYWNQVNHWPNYRALASRSSVDGGFHIQPGQTLKFLQGQLLVISPLVYLGMIAAIVGLLIYRTREDRVRFLLCEFLPIYGTFTFFSMNAAGNANWTAPALISGIIMLIVFWQKILAQSRVWRVVAILALLLAFTETAILHDTSWLHLNPRKDPLQRAKGWEDLAAHTDKWQKQYSAPIVIANHYSVASILAFYLPGQPNTFTPTPTSNLIDNQYNLWPGYKVGDDTTAIFVTDNESSNEAVPGALQSEFKHITLLEKFFTQENGRDVRQFQVYLCTNRELGS